MVEASFSPIPSVERTVAVTLTCVESLPSSSTVVGHPVGSEGDIPAGIGLSRERLDAAGFDGKVGSVLPLPSTTGPVTIAVGSGEPSSLDAAAVRSAAAAFARSATRHAKLTLALPSGPSLKPEAAAQAAVEGMLLARYVYTPLRQAGPDTAVTEIVLLAPQDDLDAVTAGAERGRAFAGATLGVRDLANTPHSHLNATRLAEVAIEVGSRMGLDVEVFDKEQLVAMGCGGLLGVNAGSAEPPRMIKLKYTPENAPTGRLTLVGKGIMYDSGGLALKPGDEVHAQMKNDMSGAAAILGAMCLLSLVKCPAAVTGYLMCTDNMPGSTATALGDVLTIRGGKTVEVVNTDAEGRLVMADALVLATEEPCDAIVDIATLTGACLRALGNEIAGVLGNNQPLVDQVKAAGDVTGEPVWQLPLAHQYRSELDSPTADLRNLGGPNAGTITAALFLNEFVAEKPWAHIDIAGTAQSPGDKGWFTAGTTGFGARLLVELALNFEPPR